MENCEWCEERRYTMMGNKNDSKYIFCVELDYNKNNEPIMSILRQKPFNPIWEVKHTKKINYCPFCGKKIKNKGE